MSIDFPYLPEGRTIKFVPAHDRFIRSAEEACRELSTDHQHPTGAVLVKDGEVIARSANKSALKNRKLLELHGNGWCVRKLFKVRTGEKYWLCPGCASSKNHAETQVIRIARKQGLEINGADLYLWGHWWCCEPCWSAMVKAGVRDVYLLEGSEYLFNRSHSDNIIGK